MHLGVELRPTRTRSPEDDDEGDFSPPPLPASFPRHRPLVALTRSFAVRTSHVPDLIRHLCLRCEKDQRCYATGPVPLPRRLKGQPTSPVSGRQPRAALQAARTDHSPARLGRHPLTEPVSLGPLSHVGLIGPFHNSTSFLALNGGLERPVRQGGPITSTRAIPHMVGANRTDALVGHLVGETGVHGVPFRAQKNSGCGQAPGPWFPAILNDMQQSSTAAPLYSPSRIDRNTVGGNPHLWIYLWTILAAQGRRPT